MRVLVVEDEIKMAALLKRGLEEEGYAVDVATDGPEGLWMALESDYAVVVLDIMLPGIDGFEVCQQMRKAEKWSPVLMLTAKDEIDARVKGLDSGADDYLTKPFSFSELAARLRALIRRGTLPRPTVLEVGDLKLDPGKRQVWKGQDEINLSPKEFSLLEMFMRHPGEVFSRTRLIEHVWDFAYDGTSNVVDQYVAYLRRKLDKPNSLTYIETVRGTGYRLRNLQH